MKIDFYLRFRTKFGESLSITGNAEELGNNELLQALPMQFLNEEFWFASIEVDPKIASGLHYQYVFTNDNGEVIKEGEKQREVSLISLNQQQVIFIDTWNAPGAFENAFYTAPFKEVFFTQKTNFKPVKPNKVTHIFKVKAPLLNSNEAICLVGNDEALRNWQTAAPVILEKQGSWWVGAIDLADTNFPVVYKYGVFDTKQGTFIRYESGDNRSLHATPNEALTIVQDGFANLPNNTWKGAGVAIPVFSLRTNNSFGVGEFADIKLLADWASNTGFKLLQLLPVNDTTATHTWQDSYPYAAISAFALHPLYINLSKVAGKKFAAALKPLSKKQKQLNSLPEVDYEAVMQFKMQMLREIYAMDEKSFLQESEYKAFFIDNAHWLKPYAAFCLLRDKYGTADFNQWKTHSVFSEADVDRLASTKNKSSKEIRFWYFVQYHLHLQLKEAVAYAHKKGLVIKGDIPIGIYRNGVDAWVAPELYHMDNQAGAPPDDFAVKGQNWGFPTYNWKRMQEDNFEWWRKRFHQMSNYFDAFRIDHILGFFRIWSIPLNAVEGILGRFVPALPIHVSEFGERSIWFDYDRYCKPYITDAVINQLFGELAETVKASYLDSNETTGRYDLKEAFADQHKIQEHFDTLDKNEENDRLRAGLFDLVTNVILFEHPDSDSQSFHFRISIANITSYQHLDDASKAKLYELYIDYFYRRQDEFWKIEALGKLPALKEATEMLICGEDLGMVPHSVPEVMQNLGILSLEIQRMPKNIQTEFFHPKDAPYLSVITPSTHDMSTLRGWWEEDRNKTQRFYNTILETQGEAPAHCDPWISRAILLQHLYAPAMWSIFQLQDLFGISEKLRRDNPVEERINQPANPKHYWRYRMHIPLEQLIKEQDFNNELKDYLKHSHRSHESILSNV
jgi:4-alpha-glucanotransferase